MSCMLQTQTELCDPTGSIGTCGIIPAVQPSPLPFLGERCELLGACGTVQKLGGKVSKPIWLSCASLAVVSLLQILFVSYTHAG